MVTTPRDLVTIAEVRTAGLTLAMASDAQVQEAIVMASVYAEKVCGQPFRAVATSLANPLLVDGTGRKEIWLDVPIVSVSACGSINSAGVKTAFPASTWMAYGRPEFLGDDRGNPKLIRVGMSSIWPEGDQNIYVVGVFGCVETDPASSVVRAPLDVRRAVLLLIVQDFAWALTDEDRQDERLRRYITSETTEGHSYSLASASVSDGPSGLREVDRILQRYGRPRKMLVRKNPSRSIVRDWL